jgi:membrane protease YdiL (CAAX protease family)
MKIFKNQFKLLLKWIYLYILGFMSSVFFIIGAFIQNSIQIFIGKQNKIIFSYNLNLINQIFHLANNKNNTNNNLNFNDYKIIEDSNSKSFFNLLSLFLVSILLILLLITIPIIKILKILIRNKFGFKLSASDFENNFVLETSKILLTIIGFEIDKPSYFSIFNKFVLIFYLIPFYFILSRPAFYFRFYFSPLLGYEFGLIFGNILLGLVMGLYIFFVLPNILGFKDYTGEFTSINIVDFKFKNQLLNILQGIVIFIVFCGFFLISLQFFISGVKFDYNLNDIYLNLSFSLIPGILEEVFFRWYLLKILLDINKQNKYNQSFIIPLVISSLAFSFGHLINVIYSPISFVALQLTYTFVYGLIFGYLFLKIKSITTLIVIHSLIDGFLLGLVFYNIQNNISASLFQILTATSLNIAIISIGVLILVFRYIFNLYDKKIKSYLYNK